MNHGIYTVSGTLSLFAIKQNRFNPPVKAVKSLIDSGQLGQLFSVQLSVIALKSAYKIPPPKSTLDVLTDHLAQQGSLNIPGQP